jgi:hypothetical protein
MSDEKVKKEQLVNILKDVGSVAAKIESMGKK